MPHIAVSISPTWMINWGARNTKKMMQSDHAIWSRIMAVTASNNGLGDADVE
jgi:hypothetical protein